MHELSPMLEEPFPTLDELRCVAASRVLRWAERILDAWGLSWSPRRFEPAEVPLPPPSSPDGIFHAGWTVSMDLSGTGAEVGFVVKCGGKLMAVLQQPRYVGRH